MKKVAKVFLIVGLVLTLGGFLVGGAGLVWYSAEVDAGVYEGNYISRSGLNFTLKSMIDEDRKVEEPYQSLDMTVADYSVTVLPSEDGSTHVRVKDVPKEFFKLEVRDGTLVLWQSHLAWGPFYAHNGYFLTNTERRGEITLYMPEQELESVRLSQSSGTVLWNMPLSAKKVNFDLGSVVELQELRAEDVTIRAGWSDMLVSSGEVQKLNVVSDGGEMDFHGLHVDEAVFDAGVGDIQITDCEFDRLEYDGDIGQTQMENVSVQTMADIRVDIGDFEGRNVRLNNAKIEAGVGRLTLEGALLGECSVEQDTGDVYLTLAYDVPLSVNVASVDLGQIRVEGPNGGETIYGDGLPVTVNGGFLNDSQAENSLTVRGGIGNMRIEFK